LVSFDRLLVNNWEHPSFAVSINAEGNYEQIDERIEIRDNTINRVDMTPEEQQKIKINLQEIAAIFYKNTPGEKLQDFESVELSVREHLIETVAPEISGFFLTRRVEKVRGETEP
jgi:hypothetical protein